MHYKFVVTEYLRRTVDVYAPCLKQALEALDDATRNADVMLTLGDFDGRDSTLVDNSDSRFDECENFIEVS